MSAANISVCRTVIEGEHRETYPPQQINLQAAFKCSCVKVNKHSTLLSEERL